MSTREVAILSAVAASCRGVWCELGSHTGWSAAHVAAAGNVVVAVDPEFTANRAMLERAQGNWYRCGLRGVMIPAGVRSREYFAGSDVPNFDGIVIDGDHTAPEPLLDAQQALAALYPAPRPGVIVLHDYRGQPVKDAVEWLRAQGMRVQTYDTMNGLAVCWRGEVAVPQ
jgi:predicted O-methyltransferase YrrM